MKRSVIIGLHPRSQHPQGPQLQHRAGAARYEATVPIAAIDDRLVIP
ncbi:hypothetical protein [Nonomuraea sp. NPDC049607]